jgi:hypothetical protein
MKRKTVKDYEREAIKIGKCLVHPVAHIARHVYQLRHGKLFSSKICVCRTCDNPQCIRDSHHFLGSHDDNMKDASAKGRLKRAQNNPEAARKKSVSMIRYFSNAAARRKNSECVSNYFAGPDARRKCSVAAKNREKHEWYRRRPDVLRRLAAFNLIIVKVHWPSITLRCVVCNKKHQISIARVLRGGGRTCSCSCGAKYSWQKIDSHERAKAVWIIRHERYGCGGQR